MQATRSSSSSYSYQQQSPHLQCACMHQCVYTVCTCYWQRGSLTCYTFNIKVKSMTSLEGIRVKCEGLQVQNISGSSCTWEFSYHCASVQHIYSPQLVQAICLPDCDCQISPWAERMISRTDSRHRISIIIATDKMNTSAINFPMHARSVTSCHSSDSTYIAYYVYTNVRLYKLMLYIMQWWLCGPV